MNIDDIPRDELQKIVDKHYRYLEYQKNYRGNKGKEYYNEKGKKYYQKRKMKNNVENVRNERE